MEVAASSSSQQQQQHQQQQPIPKPSPPPPDRDFLLHLEAFLSRRDGVDKLLKISRYTAKLLLATNSSSQALTPRLRSFESSVGLSRKAFRLGKFVQDLNSLRSSPRSSPRSDLLLSLLAYGGEGLYYFLDQLLWLSKTGLLPPSPTTKLYSKISAWAELLGYVGSVSLKIKDLQRIRSELSDSSNSKDDDDAIIRRRKLKEKMAMKRLSIVQDLADGAMALADVRDGKGPMTGPTLMASAGLLSALISAHKNWNSC
ncbi:peroxisomal membrane protein 11A [Iris pallida]|uniref:Peroxisomal membrane protein 11A n=1 Tax=Iris pallida TaxID=29817 RepID=A0AAX6DQY5_IRIPA|nr:peroxisomal membrane protein 11A [Iris pallida]